MPDRANGEATAHSNQALGAFWSRVTPPELLYIWLLSFDELRLAMNAHLPVVRPLLCYAHRGATPMHQKRTVPVAWDPVTLLVLASARVDSVKNSLRIHRVTLAVLQVI